MKKAIVIGAAVLTSSILAGCAKKNAGGTDLLEQIKSKGKMTVAMEGTWQPWTYHDESDNLAGFDVDVAKEIGKKLGVEVEFIEGEWDGLFAGLDTKRYDVILNGVEVTEERAQKYAFSEPYCFIRTVLVTKTDNNTISRFEDLKGKTTVNSIASTYMNTAESYGAKVLGVDSLDQTMTAVLHGRADATLNAEVSFYEYAAHNPGINLKVAAVSEESSPVAIPIRKTKETESFVEAVNKAIKEMKEDGTLAQISVKHFAGDITK